MEGSAKAILVARIDLYSDGTYIVDRQFATEKPASTPESFIETINTPTPTKELPKTMKEAWRPSERVLVALKSEYPQWDIESQIPVMRDWFISSGKKKVDWDATFRNWIRKSIKFGSITEKTNQPIATDLPSKWKEDGSLKSREEWEKDLAAHSERR